MTENSVWIRFDRNRDRAIFRVNGKGSFQNAPTVKDAAHRVLDEKKARSIAVDLGQCTGLDSTFLGVLAEIAVRLKKSQQGTFVFIGASGRVLEVIDNLLPRNLISFEEPEPVTDGTADQPLPIQPRPKEETTRISIQAHETLVQIHEPNAAKFQDVLEFLRKSNKSN